MKRRELMPIANKYSMDEVLEACRYYFKETGRRITFEYSLAEGTQISKISILAIDWKADGTPESD